MRTLFAAAAIAIVTNLLSARLTERRFVRLIEDKADLEHVRDLRADLDAVIATEKVRQAAAKRVPA